MFNGEEFGKQIVAATTAHIDKTVAPLLTEIGALKAEIATLKAQKQFDPAEMDWRLETFATLMREEREVRNAEGKEKRKAALADLKAGILADCETIVTERVAAIPAPKEIDLGEINANLEDLRKSVDAIPAPLPPPELPDIPAMIAEAIADSEAKALADRVSLTEAIASVEVGYKQAIADIPPAPEPPVIPDVAAMISDAIEAAKPEPVDVKALVDEAIAGKVDPDITKLRSDLDALNPQIEAVVGAIGEEALAFAKALAELPQPLTADETKAMISEAVAALPPAENGKDADPELMEALAKEYAERAVAALPAAKDGEPGSDGVTLEELLPVIDKAVGMAVSAIPAPKDGRNAVDLADMLVVEGGDVVATFTDGRTKVLGPFRGKDGEPGKDGRDVDVAAIEKLIDDKIAKIAPPEIERDAYLAEFAPEDVASNVSLAVKMMAAMPQTVQTQQRSESPPFNFSLTMPEMKAADTTINVSLPEQPPPNVTVEPSVVNVAPPNVHVETRRGKEVTKVTGWDKNGRITSFEKTEE